jgi:hypothetical protein
MSLRRVEIHAAMTVRRSRACIWDELMTPDHPAWNHPDSPARHVEGTPKVGLGAASVVLTWPFPPYGLRTVWLSEITDVNPGYSITSHLHAGLWEHIETLSLQDSDHDSTIVRIRGWHCRPARNDRELLPAQDGYTGLAVDFLHRAASWQPGDSAPGS